MSDVKFSPDMTLRFRDRNLFCFDIMKKSRVYGQLYINRNNPHKHFFHISYDEVLHEGEMLQYIQSAKEIISRYEEIATLGEETHF